MIEHLMVKAATSAPLVPVQALRFSPDGIVGGVRCPPLRQVLILPSEVLRSFRLEPGDLRENVVADFEGLHSLPSGTMLQLGEALVRLTFHCEPCRRVVHLAPASALLHQRGYLGSFLNAGCLRVGDPVSVVPGLSEPVPYDLRERLAWYLERHPGAVTAASLLWEVGLSASYARALPSLIRSLPASLREQVVFASHSRQHLSQGR